ncbi:MAG: nucleotidyltransferase domain-containing protein [Nitrososphaerales archaeon]
MARRDFKYYELPFDEKMNILEKVKIELIDLDVVFAYVYGSFLQRSLFKDLDVAVWIKNSSEAFNYTINASAKISCKLNIPVDIQVLNEAPLPFKYHVFTQGRLLFSKNEDLRLRIVDEVIRQYLDVKILMDITSTKKS